MQYDDKTKIISYIMMLHMITVVLLVDLKLLLILGPPNSL